jgi:tRNA pseudouridine13 synthase
VKIKQRPEDFVVEEIDRFETARTGPFALYRLEKWDIGTIEALQNIARAWGVPRSSLSFGGLKDRHARTTQTISIRGGPEKDFQGSAFRLAYLGRSKDPVTRASFSANRFGIVVRDLEEIPDLDPVRRWGVPNYFDDQRFGSLRGTGGEFIGRALVRGDAEKALRLAIASPSPEDRREPRRVKTLLRDRWGDWAGLAAALPRSPERSIASYLAGHPGAFGFAFEILDPNLRILFVSAYQSYLWNRTLVDLLRGLPDTFEVPYAAGKHLFFRALAPGVHDRLCELEIPLVAPGQALEGAAGEAAGRILAEEGVEPRQFRLKRLRRTFFGKGRRPALVAPAALSAAAGEDELNRGRKKVSLRFELPRGSYATILLKRLFQEPLEAGGEGPD